MAELVETKKTSDIVDISNQSSKEGIRIVLELKKGADIENLKNMLYKKTKLEDTFGVNMLAVVDGRPETLGLKAIIEHNIKFQYELATRKYTSLLNKELDQKEIKEGLIKACNIIDLIIEILRGSQSLKDAKACLTKGDTSKIKFKNKESEIYASQLCFTEKQAQAILELRLYKLIGLEILALQKDYEDIVNRIAEYEDILNNPASMKKVIKKDLLNIKKNYGVERRTVIEDAEVAVYVEKKIEEQQVMFIMDRFSYAKTIDMAAYERNKEAVHAENKYIFPCMNTDKLCLFTDTGMLHQIKILDLPFVKFRDKGTPIDNVGNYSSANENIIFIAPAQDIKDRKLLFTTQNGMMKLVGAAEFDVTKKTVAATKLAEDDKLLSITVTDAMEKAMAESLSEDVIEPVMLSGGFDDGFDGGFEGGMDEGGFGGGFDDGFGMDFGFDSGMQMQFGLEEETTDNGEEGIFTNEIVVLQTAKGMFLRFPLREIPEKKKGAIGVRGIKLDKDDYITDVYVLDAGDNLEVDFKGKKVELRKLKTTKRDGKGTKVR